MTNAIQQNHWLFSKAQGTPGELAETCRVLLPELPPSRWRSLGKRLDYTNWEDRERFVELDAAILLRNELEIERNSARRTVQIAITIGEHDNSFRSAA